MTIVLPHDTTIWVELRRPGVHYWLDPPKERRYLGMAHRHQFHFHVELTVHHQDREVEFHDLIDRVTALVDDGGPRVSGMRDWGMMSCEHIATFVGEQLLARLGQRWLRVSVSEDGEAGATVTWSAG